MNPDESRPDEVDPNDKEWQLEGEEGKTLEPNDPEVLKVRREAGDPTVDDKEDD